jgi:hypothetical protein
VRLRFRVQEGYALRRFFVAAVVALAVGSAALLGAELVFRAAMPQWSDQWKMWRIDPIHAVGLQPNRRNATVHGVSGEFAFQFSTNAQGLRMDYDLSATAVPGVKRILMVGDSFTFGYGVQQAQAFPAQLQNLLDPGRRRLEVINAGFAGGFTLDTEYLFTREIGARWRPEWVIAGVCLPNDLEDLGATAWTISGGRLVAVSKTNDYVPVWLKRSGLLNLLVKDTWPRIRRLAGRLPEDKTERRSVCALPAQDGRAPSRKVIPAPPPPRLDPSAKDWPESKKADWILRAWAHDAGAGNYRLKLLFIPDREEVQGTFSRGTIDRLLFIRSVLAAAAESAGLDVLDPAPDMRRRWCETGEAMYFDVDGHWNANGHRFIAGWLATRMDAL